MSELHPLTGLYNIAGSLEALEMTAAQNVIFYARTEGIVGDESIVPKCLPWRRHLDRQRKICMSEKHVLRR
jgi:hypothetical protein